MNSFGMLLMACVALTLGQAASSRPEPGVPWWVQDHGGGNAAASSRRVMSAEEAKRASMEQWGLKWNPLETLLNKEAEALHVRGLVRCDATIDDGDLVRWSVYFERTSLMERLGKGKAVSRGEQDALEVKWFAEMDRQLMAVSRRVMGKTFEAPELNAETAVSVSFYWSGEVEKGGGSEQCYYRGSRMVRCDINVDAPGGMDAAHIRPAPEGWPTGVELTVELAPKQREWEVGETISGSARIRNTGQYRVAIQGILLRNTSLLRKDGGVVKWVQGSPICGGCGPISSVKIKPGEQFDCNFEITTEPRSMLGFARVTDGAYRLHFGDLHYGLSIPTRCRDVDIVIRTRPERRMGHRVVSFGAGGGRLVAVCEDGGVQMVDVKTGKFLGEGRIYGFEAVPYGLGAAPLVAPDGGRFEFEQQSFRSPADGTAGIYKLVADESGEERGKVMRVRRLEPNHSFPGFCGDDASVFLQEDPPLEKFPERTEKKVILRRAGEKCVAISPDGKACRIDAGGEALELAAGGQWQYRHRAYGPAGEHCRVLLWGKSGLYTQWGAQKEIVVYRNDATLRGRMATECFENISESDDGRLLAISNGAGRVEVWETRTLRRVQVITAKSALVSALVCDPPVLVCGRMRAFDNSFCWIDAMLDVYEPRSGKLVRKLMIPYPTRP